ncbi:hypothetical protein [Flavobacterium sp.]|uniref:hypothetical protein n=1 Tax=Flavobacterium sp. TaxID=239 RepID=UPI003C45AEFD
MRRCLFLGFVSLSFLATAQEVSVEKELFGVQLGWINTSFQYEAKLDRKITLLSEIGFLLGTSTKEFNDSSIKDQTTTVVAPYITLEPRWYYSLDRRSKLNKKTYNNSSNYLGLTTSYVSTKTPIIKNGNFDIVSAVYIIPRYGIRRAFAKHFNYEFSGGVGYQYNIFSKAEGCSCDHNNTTIDIQARIGYNF